MRETEMRERVQNFMRTRLRYLLAPATLGLGLAIGGCTSDGLSADDGGASKLDSAAATRDAGSDLGGAAPAYAAPMYMAQIPDAGPDLRGAAPAYMAPMYMAPMAPTLPSSRS
jgi:hypothetical protein